MKASTSLRVMRPPSPVPATRLRSMPCSEARRRTTGESTPRRGTPGLASGRGCGPGAAADGSEAEEETGTGSAGATTGSAGATTGSAGASSGSAGASSGSAGTCSGAGVGTSSAAAITASGVPTVTVSPSATRISCTTPAAGDGTSASTLSVEISRSTSSASMESPGCLAHLRMVPSVMVSPSCGIVTVTAIRALSF